jgi:serine/threonine-protein kinase
MVFRGQTLGKYRILEPLGSGGFGTVYLAEDTWIDKRVALKVPHRQNLDFGELLREPRLLASLNHPNIVTVITAEKQDGVFFIVMEYVPGETLETVITAKGALDVATVLDYTCQIVNAVEHAHKQGVIHRDLRPANVFVTEKGVVKVGDFGTSRFLEIAAHGTTVIGSPPYMAPEQFEGRAVFASDLYSLGITMYQMLTGELPYDTPAPSDLDRLRRGEMVKPPRLRHPHLPLAVDDIVMRALAGSLAERYQRAEDVLHDILNVRRELSKKGTIGWAGALSSPASPAPAPDYHAPVAPAAAAGHDHVVSERLPLRMPRKITPARIRTREVTATRFCWNCRKPLPAKAARCPFCDENQ